MTPKAKQVIANSVLDLLGITLGFKLSNSITDIEYNSILKAVNTYINPLLE